MLLEGEVFHKQNPRSSQQEGAMPAENCFAVTELRGSTFSPVMCLSEAVTWGATETQKTTNFIMAWTATSESP